MADTVANRIGKEDVKKLSPERNGGDIDEELMEDMVRGEDDDDMSDSDESDEVDRFKHVIDAIDFERLPELAVSVRRGNVHSDMMDMSLSTHASNAPLTCKVVTPPLTGSYNILYRLEFSDGVRWMFKVPITGSRVRFDELAEQALISEALTMRLLKRKTTIPVPEVHFFNTSFDNVVKCPFIMMDCLEGRPLHELWFQPRASQATVEVFRERVLQQLAAALVQLSAFTYDRGGALLFDQAGNVIGIGPARVNDLTAEYHRLSGQDDDNDDDSPLYYGKGPVKHPKSFLGLTLKRGPHQARKYHQGMHKLMGLFIDWMSYDHTGGGSSFVLAHPDLAYQNVLVSDDGTLQGIIDWDGAAAVPRCCGQYPLWLMADWDPFSYNWDSKTSELKDAFGPPEDSPEKLAYYRTMYGRFIEQFRLEMDSSTGTVSKVALDFVNPRSLIFRTLAVAIEDPMSTGLNIGFIFDEIERLTAANWDEADDNSEPDTSDPLPQVSAKTYHQPCHAVLEELEQFGDKEESREVVIDHSSEERVAELEDDALPSCPKLQPITVGHGSGHNMEPLCYRIKGGLNYMAKLLHKKKEKKAKACNKDKEPLSTPGASSSAKGAKPGCGPLRGAFEHTPKIFRKNKLGKSSEGTGAQATKSCTNEDPKLLRNRMRDVFRRALPCLRKSKLEKPKAQATVKPTNAEDDLVWSQLRSELEGAGISARMIKGSSTALITAIKQATQHKQSQDGMSHRDPSLLESPESIEIPEGKTKPCIKDSTDTEAYEPSLFNLWDINHALADGILPEESMVRLKEGFATLLASASK